MKFGKRIQSQQLFEWSCHYLDYKCLKKFIKSSFNDDADTLESKKASFFFKLERELEKINSFYLNKENELKVRLKTLTDKRKLIQLDSARLAQSFTQLESLVEAFTQFERDLNKLKNYAELNKEGFRKILKKWDKKAKTNTKDLYLSRQIDIQPCFDDQLFSELIDTASTSRFELLELIKTSKNYAHEQKKNMPQQQKQHQQLQQQQASNTMNMPIDDIEMDLLRALSSNQMLVAQAELERFSNLLIDKFDYPDRISRLFFHACLFGTSVDIINLLIETHNVRFDYIDDINERSCLHVVAMNGRLDILEAICQHSNFTNTCTTTINVRDIYGRTPLHYAAMKGYDDCVSYLLDQHADIEARDLDGFSPLVCAIINGRTVSVDILLNAGANIEPENDKDHIPLSLACFYGHTDIALMLYHRGAKTRCDRELLYPLHLVAQKGHVELCRILSKDHEYLDKPDIYYNWTPLFWAANYGHIECVRILISEGCQLNLKDGNGKTALHYAAWEGHTKCAQLMMDAGCHGNVDAFPPKESIYQNIVNDINKHPITQPPSLNDDIIMEENLDIPLELDNIPSLELPPPIIPFRIYGHNYLDKKYQIHIMLKQPPIRLYDNTPISSIKLVISMKPDIGVIPHSLILPLAHRRENIYFHIDSLDNFLLEFDVLPTFGKRILGRGVLPVCDFKISEGHRIIPLLDTHLNAVGELVFDYCIIKPFLGVQLEIGGRIETYWKSKMIGATLLTGVTENLKPATAVSSFVTASSLSGDYVHLVVQLTKDRVPIIFTNWMIPCDGLDLAVSDLALHQINQLVANFLSQGVGNLHDFTGNVYLIDDFKLEREVLTLQKALQKLPSEMGVLLEVKYPNIDELDIHSFSNILDKNSYVDTVLQCIYGHVRSLPIGVPSTRIIFTSFNPAICTVINWKQPNFAVFFSTCCRINKQTSKFNSNVDNFKISSFLRSYSDSIRTTLKEAVKFVKRNNILGIMTDAATLVQVPSLISNIKENGLVLVTFGHLNNQNDPECILEQIRLGVDAIMVQDLLRFKTEMTNAVL